MVTDIELEMECMIRSVLVFLEGEIPASERLIRGSMVNNGRIFKRVLGTVSNFIPLPEALD